MKRDYKTGVSSKPIFFTGTEVEHTPAFGLHTLFVVDIQDPEEVVEYERPALESSENESKVLQTIKKLDEGDGIYYDDLGIAVSLEGIDGPMLDEILDSLTDQGLIFQPRFNHYKEA